MCRFSVRYVCDEANVETDGMKPMGRLANDWGWEAAFVSRAKRMVQRDYNHPCIIFWSLGNESGRGRNLLKARKAVLELDTSRPICYEGGEKPMQPAGRVTGEEVAQLIELFSYPLLLISYKAGRGRKVWEGQN
jgi:beta-galactosidase/beta-glucuronidase